MSKLGLFKQCPRCGRMGEVVLDGRGHFEIHWAEFDGSREYKPHPASVDSLVSFADCVRPTFGCGYDSPRVPRASRREGAA